MAWNECEECGKKIPSQHYLCRFHWVKEQKSMAEKEKSKDSELSNYDQFYKRS
jgi:hypothetical protein